MTGMDNLGHSTVNQLVRFVHNGQVHEVVVGEVWLIQHLIQRLATLGALVADAHPPAVLLLLPGGSPLWRRRRLRDSFFRHCNVQ